MNRWLGITLFLILTVTPGGAWAQEAVSNEELLKEIRSLKETVARQAERITQLEARLDGGDAAAGAVAGMTQAELDQHIDSRLSREVPGGGILEGVSLGVGMTTIYQATNGANGDDLSQSGEDTGDASYSFDLGIEKKFEDYGMAFIHLQTGDGAGVEDELKVFSSVNADADDSDNAISLTEGYYEHYAGPMTVTVGKIDATGYIDTNEYANDETAQFLGHMFGNSPTIEFPDNAGGLRLAWALNDVVDVEAVAMDADSDWEDLFDDGFYAAQVNLKPGLFGRDGNYRILGWMNDREHTRWDDATMTKERGYGFGLSVDQNMSDHVGLFARYAWQAPGVFLDGEDFSLEQAYSLGTRIGGGLWGRAEDSVGLAFGQIFPSGDYKDAGSLQAKAESHLEAFYSYRVNPHLTLAPDLHVIWAPYGKDAANGDDTIIVGGIRSQVDF